MTAADTVYGRRGGRWVGHRPGRLLDELRQLRDAATAAGEWPAPVDHTRMFHPETIATARTHNRDCNDGHKPDEPCPARPDPVDLEAVWAGLARMARGRKASGQRLRALDAEALNRQGRGR